MPTTIKVSGSDYRESFEHAVKLIGSGLLSDMGRELYTSDGGRRIHDGNTVYVFEDGDGSVTEEAELGSFEITEEGGSWFDNVRKRSAHFDAGNRGEYHSEGDKSEIQKWKDFVLDLSRSYHSKYFLVAHRVKRRAGAKAERINEENKALIRKIMGTFYPHLGRYGLALPPSEREMTVNIYEVLLRLHVRAGVEIALPVMGRLYFKDIGGFIPLDCRTGKTIEKYFREVGGELDTSEINEDVSDVSRKTSELIRSIGELIKADVEGTDVVSRISFEESDSRRIKKTILSRMRRDDKVLQCSGLEVLGVTRYTVYNKVVDILDGVNQTPLFRATFAFDGSVTLSCLGCKEGGAIICDNEIRYVDPDTGDRRCATLAKDTDNLLDDDELDAVRRSGVFSMHYMQVGSKYCNMGKEKRACQSHRCREHLVELTVTGGEKELFCKNCPHPEIIWRGDGGELTYTRRMKFVSDEIKLIPEEKPSGICSCCGRRVVSLTDFGALYKLCPLCHDAHREGSDPTEARARYEKYRELMPLSARLLSKNSEKLCYEDGELLLFKLGDRFYMFNKLWITDEGIVKGPERIR